MVALTGSTGRLGRTLMELHGDEIIPTTFRLENTDDMREFFRLHNEEIHLVVHAAALVDVCEAERNPKKGFDINVTGTYNIAMMCKEFSKPLIFISTDHIFDGEKGGLYSELDKPTPQGVYSVTKCLAEQIVLMAHPNNLVLRTSFIKEFLFDAAFTDKYFSGDTAEIIAEDVWLAASHYNIEKYKDWARSVYGGMWNRIIHVVGKRVSIYDIAKKVRPSVKEMVLADNPINKVGLPYLKDVSLDNYLWVYIKHRIKMGNDIKC